MMEYTPHRIAVRQLGLIYFHPFSESLSPVFGWKTLWCALPRQHRGEWRYFAHVGRLSVFCYHIALIHRICSLFQSMHGWYLVVNYENLFVDVLRVIFPLNLSFFFVLRRHKNYLLSSAWHALLKRTWQLHASPLKRWVLRKENLQIATHYLRRMNHRVRVQLFPK